LGSTMSDLVERLRGPVMADFGLSGLGNEAADEIERLRAVIDLAARSLTAACLWRRSLSDAVAIARKSGPPFPELLPQPKPPEAAERYRAEVDRLNRTTDREIDAA